jgi:dephospho-CoA kinase
VKRVAIAGGIGAGKSAVTEHLTSLGWPVVDADVVARKVVEPGEPAWRALRDAFGTAVLTSTEELDRAFLAEIVFHDATALRRLNAITHGYIGREMARELDALTGPVAFVAIPLYRAEHRSQLALDEVWAIEVEPETAVARLTALRGFSEEDARARLAAQITNEERSAAADRVIWNEGTLLELYAQIDEALAGLGSS